MLIAVLFTVLWYCVDRVRCAPQHTRTVLVYCVAPVGLRAGVAAGDAAARAAREGGLQVASEPERRHPRAPRWLSAAQPVRHLLHGPYVPPTRVLYEFNVRVHVPARSNRAALADGARAARHRAARPSALHRHPVPVRQEPRVDPHLPVPAALRVRRRASGTVLYMCTIEQLSSLITLITNHYSEDH